MQQWGRADRDWAIRLGVACIFCIVGRINSSLPASVTHDWATPPNHTLCSTPSSVDQTMKISCKSKLKLQNEAYCLWAVGGAITITT